MWLARSEEAAEQQDPLALVLAFEGRAAGIRHSVTFDDDQTLLVDSPDELILFGAEVTACTVGRKHAASPSGPNSSVSEMQADVRAALRYRRNSQIRRRSR